MCPRLRDLAAAPATNGNDGHLNIVIECHLRAHSTITMADKIVETVKCKYYYRYICACINTPPPPAHFIGAAAADGGNFTTTGTYSRVI